MYSVRLTPHLLLAIAALLVAISPVALAVGEETAQPPAIVFAGGDNTFEPAPQGGDDRLLACTPIIEVSPDPLAFGDVQVGQAFDVTLTIDDGEEGALCFLTVTSIAFLGTPGSFEFVTAPIPPYEIEPGQPLQIAVRFSPSLPQAYNATIRIESDDPTTPVFDLAVTGTGTQPNDPPVCDAGGPYDGEVEVAVAFDGTGSSDPDGTVETYAWDFGDGENGSGATPSHTYTSVATYTVTLTVTDDSGDSTSCATTAEITGGFLDPICDAGGDYFGTINNAVAFDGTGSSDPDGGTVTYAWDFGDGSTGTGATPSNTYTTPAIYTVTLVVTDDETATSECSTTADIGEGPQDPVCDAGGPYDGQINIAVDFDGTGSSDPDGGTVTYAWDFGDGSNGTGPEPSHTYTTADTYTVTLVVTDDETATSECSAIATISEPVQQDPICDAGGTYNGEVDVAVDFDGTGSSDPDGTVEAYAWDFGDGSTGTGATPSHTYTAADTYTVTLVVTDNDALTSECATTATITGGGTVPPDCDAGGPYTGEPNVNIAFDGSGSSDPDGDIVSYAWEFGDGSTGAGAQVNHTYTVGDLYTVTLVVTDDDALTSECTTTADARDNLPPDCDAGGPYTVEVSTVSQFDGTGSNDPDGTIVSYDWEFGDGGVGSAPIIEHAFAHLGTSTVTLTVTDDDGAATTCTTTVDVVLPPGTIQVAVPPFVYGIDGDDMVVPIFVMDDVTGDGIIASEIALGYNPNLITFQGVSLAGTIGDGGVHEVNIEQHGPMHNTAHISIAWVVPIAGCETMANVLFRVNSNPAQEDSDLELDVVFNEGDPPTFTQDGEFIYGVLGDVNGSGNVSAIDASLVLQETVGLIDLPDPSYPFFRTEIADVSGNAAISAFDASLILRFVLGIIDVFPANDLLHCGTPFTSGQVMAGITGTVPSRTASLAMAGALADGTFEVLVSLDEMAGVYGGEFDLVYDRAVLRAVEVTSLAAGDQVLNASRIDDGVVHLALATARSLSGPNAVAKVRFERLAAAPTAVQFTRVELNEGRIPVVAPVLDLPAGTVSATTLVDTVHVAVPPRSFGARGQDVAIPFFLEDDVTGMEIYSAQIVLGYKPSIINAFDVDLAGTIGEDGVAQINVIETGPIRHEAHISIAWVNPLEGCEAFARLMVEVENGEGQSALDLEVSFNEGDPAVVASGGLFIIGLLGDVNGSGQVSALDASLVLQEVVGLITLPDPQYPEFTMEVADVSGNEEIRAFDAALILQYVLGIIDVFPADEQLVCGGDFRGQGSPATARTLELRELGRGNGWVDLMVSADDLRGIIGTEMTLRMAGGELEVIEVESQLHGSGTLLEHRAEGSRLTLAAASADARGDATDIARIRIAAPATGAELKLESATMNEGAVPVVLKGAAASSVPASFSLLQNVPNPFNPTTQIEFVTPVASRVRLAIYDSAGRMVKVLVNGMVEPGEHAATWDGRDTRGQGVGAGVYFYALETPTFSQTRKMILLK